MAQRRFYVYLNENNTGTHAGTIDDPYSYEDFETNISAAQCGDIYLMRGYRNITSGSIYQPSLSGVKLIAWDVEEYGPWRIVSESIDGSDDSFEFNVSSYIENGIISVKNLSFLGGAKNCYFSTHYDSESKIYPFNGSFENCSFTSELSATLSTSGENLSANFTRCLFSNFSISAKSDDTINITNCITDKEFSATFLGGAPTYIQQDITYNWTLPQLLSGFDLLSGTNLPEFALDGGSPSIVSSAAGVGYNGWGEGNTYFVDLSYDTTSAVSANGYYGEDYIGYFDMLSLLNSSATFRCRGYRNINASISTSEYGCLVDAWDVDKYGPWRIYDPSNYSENFRVHFKNGILDGAFVPLSLENVYYILNLDEASWFIVNSYLTENSPYIKNSTIEQGDDVIYLQLAYTEIENSIFRLHNEMDSGASTFTNCITNRADDGFLYNSSTNTLSGMTYDWSPPTMPSRSEVDINSYIIEGTPTAENYGQKNFPSYVYVDISPDNDTSHSDGSDSNYPASFAYFNDYVGLKSRTTFYLKGNRNIETGPLTACDWHNHTGEYRHNYVESWNKSSYGPWALKLPSFQSDGISLKDGIIYSDTITLGGYIIDGISYTPTYETMFLHAKDNLYFDSGNKTVNGCTIISSANPIEFKETIYPDWLIDSYNYICEYFQTDRWWLDSETEAVFSRALDPSTGRAVLNYTEFDDSGLYRFYPNSASNVAGDFQLNFSLKRINYFSFLGNDDGELQLQLRKQSDDSLIAYAEIFDDSGSYGIDLNGTSALSGVNQMFLQFDRTGSDIYLRYSLDEIIWNSVLAASDSSDFYLSLYANNGAFNPFGLGDLRLQAASGFSYTIKDDDAYLLNTVIDTDEVTEGSWDYGILDLASISQTDSTWSGVIDYSGINQENLTKPDWPSWEDIETEGKYALSYADLGNDITLIQKSFSGTDVPTGLYGELRYNVGAFYFPPGHIGSFYFGPLTSAVIISADVLELNSSLPSNSILGAIGISEDKLESFLIIRPPTIRSFTGIVLDFSATPRNGTSPLEVDFWAIPRLLGNYADNYEITEYRWYFDFIREPSTYESTTDINITHTYTGYAGKKFAVKLVAIVEAK